MQYNKTWLRVENGIDNEKVKRYFYLEMLVVVAELLASRVGTIRSWVARNKGVGCYPRVNGGSSWEYLLSYTILTSLKRTLGSWKDDAF